MRRSITYAFWHWADGFAASVANRSVRPSKTRGATMCPDLRLCQGNEQKREPGLVAGAHIADEITARGTEDKKSSDAELI